MREFCFFLFADSDNHINLKNFMTRSAKKHFFCSSWCGIYPTPQHIARAADGLLIHFVTANSIMKRDNSNWVYHPLLLFIIPNAHFAVGRIVCKTILVGTGNSVSFYFFSINAVCGGCSMWQLWIFIIALVQKRVAHIFSIIQMESCSLECHRVCSFSTAN